MNFLLFVRRFNDVDHIVPIAHALASAGERVTVLAQTPDLPLRDDFRLRYLKQRFGIRTKHMAFKFSTTSREYWLKKAAEAGMALGLSHTRAWDRLIGEIRLCCGPQWANTLIDEIKPDAIVFDWSDPSRTSLSVVLECAAKRSIPIIAVPHGVNYMTNDLYTRSAIESGVPHEYGRYLKCCDWVITQHRRHARWLTLGGVPRHKIAMLGSTRFSDGWRKILEDIAPKQPFVSQSGAARVKVAYMDHTAEFRLNVQTIERSLERLAALHSVDLVVKPTTGGRDAYASKKLRQLARGADKANSRDLVAWADVVMGTTSSILLEALQQNKTLIYPAFYHENNQLFDEMGACWRVDTQEELESALLKVSNHRKYRPYSDDNVARFLTEVVLGGNAKRDVLADYGNFIVNAARRNIKIEDWSDWGGFQRT